MVRIENEHEIDQFFDYIPAKNSVLNIDLDFFSDDLARIPEAKKLAVISYFFPLVKHVTIATSPFFIE
jgi:hypothetical protein